MASEVHDRCQAARSVTEPAEAETTGVRQRLERSNEAGQGKARHVAGVVREKKVCDIHRSKVRRKVKFYSKDALDPQTAGVGRPGKVWR